MIQTQIWINHPSQASQIAQVMRDMQLFPTVLQLHSHPLSFDLPLGGVWILYDQGQETIDACSQIRSQSKSTFWGIIIVGESLEPQQKVFLGQGADRYLAYPFDRPILEDHVRRLVDEKTPVSLYNVLPPKLANAIDKISLKLADLNYYELLELSTEADSKDIQTRFHQRSLVLHPDRHRKLKSQYPQIYHRVNEIYKHLVEAYRVLSNPDQNQLYQLMISDGLLRWNDQKAREYYTMMELSTIPEVQKGLLQVLTLRRKGHLFKAYHVLQKLAKKEPAQSELHTLVSHYQKIISLIQRDPTLYQGHSS